MKKILKIVLKDDGLKGIVVTFEKPSKRLDMNFRDKHTVHFKAPVNAEISAAMEAFKPHLVALNNLNPDIAYDEIRITDLEAHDGWFKIGARIRSVGVSEYISRTAKVDDSDGQYDGVKDAVDCVSALYGEVRSYITEKKVMDPAQIVMQFNRGNDDFDDEAFDKLTDAEKTDEARRHLEQKGMIVIELEEGGESDNWVDGLDPLIEESEADEPADGLPENPVLVEDVEPVTDPAVVVTGKNKGKVRKLNEEVVAPVGEKLAFGE